MYCLTQVVTPRAHFLHKLLLLQYFLYETLITTAVRQCGVSLLSSFLHILFPVENVRVPTLINYIFPWSEVFVWRSYNCIACLSRASLLNNLVIEIIINDLDFLRLNGGVPLFRLDFFKYFSHVVFLGLVVSTVETSVIRSGESFN